VRTAQLTPTRRALTAQRNHFHAARVRRVARQRRLLLSRQRAQRPQHAGQSGAQSEATFFASERRRHAGRSSKARQSLVFFVL